MTDNFITEVTFYDGTNYYVRPICKAFKDNDSDISLLMCKSLPGVYYKMSNKKVKLIVTNGSMDLVPLTDLTFLFNDAYRYSAN